jgi:predicted PurR-regulated permease PerM
MKAIHESDPYDEKKIIDRSIRLLLLIVLLAWCVMIILPFVIPVLWGIILAITIFPIYKKLLKPLKGKKVLAGVIIAGILLVLLIVPSVWLISRIVDGTGLFINALHENTLKIPPPKPSVADWPLIGDRLYNGWLLLTTNLEAAILKYSDQIIKYSDKFLGVIGNFASSVLMMMLSIIIAGIFLVGHERSEKSTLGFASRIGGKQAEEFVTLIIITIRNVAKGILGVAFIQFVLMGVALVIAKVPFAGLWALAVLLLAMVQMPAIIVVIPVAIYLFSTREPLPAALWTLVLVLVGMSDNVLKPWLMGKGAPVPMLVIFLGAVGGMIMSGFIGLFTGAIILSLGYKLVMIWFRGDVQDQQTESPA